MRAPPRSAPLALLPLALLWACATASVGRPQPVRCGYAPLPPAWRAPGKVLLFGELHGTRELPEAFGEMVCHAAGSGPVVVGLEHPLSEERRLAALLAASSEAERSALLRSSPFWTSRYQYGATSRAMAALLARLAVLRAAGLPVEVFAFDQEKDAPAAGRDERMAAAVASKVRERPGAQVLVLTGNLHAGTDRGAPWDPSARFMGAFLKDAGLDVVGLDFAGKGLAWACMAPDRESVAHVERQVCGPTPIDHSANAAGPGLTILASPAPEGFLGRWGVPSLSASPPALAP